MAERQTEMPDTSTISKNKMRELFCKQVSGTENLYQGIGYFMRMRYWETINKPEFITKIKNACEEDKCREIYDYMMSLMTLYIDGTTVAVENKNNMIFNRTMVKNKYEHCPQEYVKKLRECLEIEQELLTVKPYITMDQNQTGLVSSGLPIASQRADHMEDIKENVLTVDVDVAPKLSTICFDTSFLNAIDKKHSECRHSFDFEELLRLMKDSLVKLKEIRDQFLQYQAQMEVGLMQKEDIYVSAIFDRYAKYLNLEHFHSSPGCPSEAQLEIIKEYMNIALVVKIHPEGYAFIENPKKPDGEDEQQMKVKKEKGESSKYSKAKGPKYFCSKKKSHLSATLMILGGRHLKEFLNVNFPSVMLITEEGEKAGELSVPNEERWKDSEISLQGIKVFDHKRESAKNTRSQFLRLSFTVQVVCHGQEFQLQTKSLPFNLVTGSLQALEFTGTRLWYFFCNMGNMYSNCRLNEELSRADFLSMLDQIIKTMTYGRKYRALSFNDRNFLWNQIPPRRGRTSGATETISESCFTKTEIGKSAEMGQYERKFSFFTWFYAMVNTFEKCLLKPWVDGIIYGLMTKKDAEEVLHGDNIPPLTALLRPVRSFVMTPNCKAAQIKIAVEIKYRSGDDDKIGVLDICADEFKKLGLHGRLERIHIKGHNDDTSSSASKIKYILTANNKLVPIIDLKDRYPPSSSLQNPSASSGAADEGYHKNVVERFSELWLDVRDKEAQSDFPPAAKNAKHSPDVCSPPAFSSRNRKTSRRESSEAASIYTGSPFTTTSSPNGNYNEAWSPGAISNGTTAAFSPPFQEQVDSYDEVAVNQDFQKVAEMSNPSASPKWENFGPVQVDIAKMPKRFNGNGPVDKPHSSLQNNMTDIPVTFDSNNSQMYNHSPMNNIYTTTAWAGITHTVTETAPAHATNGLPFNSNVTGSAGKSSLATMQFNASNIPTTVTENNGIDSNMGPLLQEVDMTQMCEIEEFIETARETGILNELDPDRFIHWLPCNQQL